MVSELYSIPQPVVLPEAVPLTLTPETPSSSTFASVLRAIGKETQRGEATLQRALVAPPDLSVAELLALQAGVYRYVETVDLASKLIDRATQSIRSVTQGGSGG